MFRERVRVSIPVFFECDPSIIYGVFDTLWAAGKVWDTVQGGVPEGGLFEPRLVAAQPGPLELITGVSIVPQDTVDSATQTDVVFVPNVIVGLAKGPSVLDRRLIDWIRRMHAQGAQMYGTCGGALVLAEAGLLGGETATTHWVYEPVFRKFFPDVKLNMERVLVQGGPGHNLVCGGGASSWQDLALLLVSKYGGTEEAIRMSKLFLYQWHRDGQLPYASMVQNVDHGDGVILKCQDWIAQHYQRQDIIAELVRQSGLPKRSFDRRFRAGHRILAARLYPNAAHRRGEATARNEQHPGRAGWTRSRLRGCGLVPAAVSPPHRHRSERLPAQVPATCDRRAGAGAPSSAPLRAAATR